MLSDRERCVLERIEAHLRETDPDLVRMFREGPPRPPGQSRPRALLVLGLLVTVLGSVVEVVPVALLGLTITFWGLWLACTSGLRMRPHLT